MPRYLGKTKLIQPREALAIAAAAVILAGIFNYFDMFDRLVRFMQRHEDWQLDEIYLVLTFGGIGALVLAIRRGRDLAEEMRQREAAEARAVTLARHDPLTGLPNRRVLHEELHRLLASAGTDGKQSAVFMVDLDHFKPVNDMHGHDIGDAVLVEVSTRLQRACDSDALVARAGGDEFVVVMPHDAGNEAPARWAMRIIRMLSEPYRIGDRRLEIGATIGIARCPQDGTEGDELLRAADVAMYEGKRAGKGTYRFFHAEMDERLRSRAMLEAEMKGAIERGEIVPYFQPVMSLTEDRITGFEALARWHHPIRGVIAPDEFIPIAEDIGLIEPLSSRILREGCLASRDWHPDTTLSINISPIQLKDPWLSARLLGILSETGFPASRLIVEVTENAIIDDIDLAAEVFASLQNAGIRVALDDFGKGYSSLSHLRQLRFNHLKIDSSFVRSMESAESQKIVSAVAGLGKALGMPVTAEGVETQAAAQALRELGCEQAQGYLFGAPAPAQEAANMLDADDAREHVPLKRAHR